MRFLELTLHQTQLLSDLYKTSSDHRERQRAHALLLNSRGHSIPFLAELFEVDRETITRWLDRFADSSTSTNTLSLQDQARSGRPTTLAEDQKK